jgi:trk system potassium uptake protein TrkH
MFTHISQITPIFIGFSFIILLWIETAIFMLPHCFISHKGCALGDALFNAASTLCSTGTLSIPYESFSFLGKILFLIMIQIGGVGLITLIIGVAVFITKKNMFLFTFAADIFDIEGRKKIIECAKVMFISIITIESLGMIACKVISYYSNNYCSWFDALFYSIDFFCNAGFSVHNNNLLWLLNTNAHFIFGSLLIILGSLGFIFLFEVIEKFILKTREKFSFTVKLIVWGYGISTSIGWFLYWYYYEQNTPLMYGLGRSLFAAVSLRNCGFLPYDIAFFTKSGFVWTALYSILGGCPLSTGGGIKNSAVVIFFATIYSIIMQKDQTIIFKKKVSSNVILYTFFVVIYIIFGALIITNILNNLLMEEFDYGILFSNIISMITGSGLLWDTISQYSQFVRMVFVIAMCYGKFGITFFMLRSTLKKNRSIIYPEEKIILL